MGLCHVNIVGMNEDLDERVLSALRTGQREPFRSGREPERCRPHSPHSANAPLRCMRPRVQDEHPFSADALSLSIESLFSRAPQREGRATTGGKYNAEWSVTP